MTTLTALEWFAAFSANVVVWWALWRVPFRNCIYVYQAFSAAMSLMFPLLYWMAAYRDVDSWQMRTYHLAYDATALICMVAECLIAYRYRDNTALCAALAAHRLLKALSMFVEIPHAMPEFIMLDVYRRGINLIVMGLFVKLAYPSASATALGEAHARGETEA